MGKRHLYAVFDNSTEPGDENFYSWLVMAKDEDEALDKVLHEADGLCEVVSGFKHYKSIEAQKFLF